MQHRKVSPAAARPLPEAVNHLASLSFAIWPWRSSGPMALAHTHPDVEVNYLVSGCIRYFFAGRFHTIRAGEIALFWAGMPHQTVTRRGDTPDEAAGIWLTLPLVAMLEWKHAAGLVERLLRGRLVSYPATERDAGTLRQWLADFSAGDAVLREIAIAEMEAYFSRRSHGLAATRPPRPEPGGERIEAVLRHLGAHYTEPISVESVARAIGLHPKYLLALFRTHCGMGLWEYVIRLRLAHARRLRLTTRRTVTDIAFEAGFGSLGAYYHAARKTGEPAADPIPAARRRPLPEPS